MKRGVGRETAGSEVPTFVDPAVSPSEVTVGVLLGLLVAVLLIATVTA